MSEQPLKVLVIGSGGREHAIVQACLKSPLASEVIAAPGNGGMSQEVECFPVDVEDIQAIARLAVDQSVDFAIVGPEVPLCLGAVDVLNEAGITAYGPNKKAAQLEGSKVFTKDFLFKYNIPTAMSETFRSGENGQAISYLNKVGLPIVIKASGLAAGKGVIIAQDQKVAVDAIQGMLSGDLFGDSGNELLVEEFLEGEEASITIMVSGKDYVMLPAAQDHKRAGEGDTGPNTGGMGAYAPAAVVTPEMDQKIREQVIEPTLGGFVEEGIDFRGTLFIGIMISKGEPKVLEFNVRFGDPETQVLLPLMETDPLAVMIDCAKGQLKPADAKIRDEYALVVVLAAKGYPGKYGKGDAILLPKSISKNACIVHAGTVRDEEGVIRSNGGRVLGVTAFAKSLKAASKTAYTVCDKIDWKNKYLRRDIGFKQLEREK